MFKRPKPFEEKPVPEAYAAKWSSIVLDEGFLPFPRKLMRCLSVLFTGSDAVEELQVVLAISDAKRSSSNKHYRPPTLGFLAYNAGMNENEFMKHVNKMQERKILVVRDADEKHFDVDLGLLLRLIELATPEGS